MQHFYKILTPGEWLIRLGLIIFLLSLFFLNIINLKRLLTGFFAVYLIFFSGFGNYSSSLFTDLNEWSWAQNGKQLHFRGTGFFINNNFVITNEHVVRGCKQLAIRKYQHDPIIVEQVAVDSKKDLAILASPLPSQYYAILREHEHIAKEPI